MAELAVLPRCARRSRREAKEALAIHHEHRLKDLQAARQHALDLLAKAPVTPRASSTASIASNASWPATPSALPLSAATKQMNSSRWTNNQVWSPGPRCA